MYNVIYYILNRTYKKISNEEVKKILEKHNEKCIVIKEEDLGFVKSGVVIKEDNIALLEVEEEMLKDYLSYNLRNKREFQCFPIINRGKLWYDNLTQEQLEELNKWYNDWLNVTETLKEPVKPEWLK